MTYLERRIQSFQNECDQLISSLSVLYSELKAGGMTSNAELGYLVDCSETAEALSENVDSSNIVEKERKLIELEKELKRAYGKGTIKEVYRVPERKSKASVEKPSKALVFGAGVLTGAVLLGVGSCAINQANSNGRTLAAASNLEVVSESDTRANTGDEIVIAATEDNDSIVVATIPTPTPTPTPIVTPGNGGSVNQDATTSPIVVAPIATPTPTSPAVGESSEEVAYALLLGEPGTFLDITDDEQVEARAVYIYDNYFAPYLHLLSDSERNFISVERIANTIRVVNGRCPIDQNGYKFMDANTTDTFSQSFVELYANTPSSDVMGIVQLVPAHLFAIDGSEVQEFLKTYDELYARVAEGRNNRDSAEYRAAAKILEAKMWYEWHCQGMGGNIVYHRDTDDVEALGGVTYNENTGTYEYRHMEENENHEEVEVVTILRDVEVYPVHNPHNIDATYRYLAYMGSMYRFGSYIEEAEHNQMAPICANLCVDFHTKELNEYTIDEVYTGIDTGIWNNIIAQHAGMADQVPGIPFCIGFWEALNAQLEYDYTHSQTLRLN